MTHHGHPTARLISARAAVFGALMVVTAAAIVVGLPDVAAAGLEWRNVAQLQPADEPDTARQLGRMFARILVPGLIVFFVVRAVRRNRRRSQPVVEQPLPKIETTSVD